MKGIVKFVIALLCLAAFGPSEILADEGRIPLHSLPGPTFIIIAPGHYILTEDVVFAGVIIVIQSNEVTVDLNGFTLTEGGAFPVIVIDANFATRDITIRNGTLLRGTQGIQWVGAAAAPRIRVRIEKVEVADTTGRGISIDRAEYVEIVSCRVRNAGSDGIFVSGFNELFGGRILDNRVEGADGFGILLAGLQGGEVRRNLTSGYGMLGGFQAGIRLIDVGAAPGLGAGGNIIEGNTAVRPVGVQEDGINLNSSDGNLIENNVVKANTACGIRLENSSRNKLHENVAEMNTLNGMDTVGASDGNLFLMNVGGNNGGLGIDCAGAANQVRGNVFVADGIGAGCVDAGGNIP